MNLETRAQGLQVGENKPGVQAERVLVGGKLMEAARSLDFAQAGSLHSRPGSVSNTRSDSGCPVGQPVCLRSDPLKSSRPWRSGFPSRPPPSGLPAPQLLPHSFLHLRKCSSAVSSEVLGAVTQQRAASDGPGVSRFLSPVINCEQRNHTAWHFVSMDCKC